MDECRPLDQTWRATPAWPYPAAVKARAPLSGRISRPLSINTSSERVTGGGLHSSTFRLNVSAFCGIRVHLGALLVVFTRY